MESMFMEAPNKATVYLSFELLMRLYEEAQLTGKELYDAYGLKRNELLLSESVEFFDGCTMDLELVVGEEDEKPELHVMLVSETGAVVADVSEDYDNDAILGTFSVDDDDTGKSYSVTIGINHCAIPINKTDYESDEVTTAYCDSDWLVKKFSKDDENLLKFLHEYTSDESSELIALAELDGAIAFEFCEGDDEPFVCNGKDAWKYEAFADAISGFLNKEYPEASKALDAFLNL